EGGALLVHVDEDLAERPVFVLAGPEEDLVTADAGLLRIPMATLRQADALAVHSRVRRHLQRELGALGGGALRQRREQRLGRVRDRRCLLFALLALLAGARERLARLAPVAVQGDGLESEPPALLVDRLHVVYRRVVREVDRLRDGAAQEGLRRRHHSNVRHGREITDALLAATVRAIEHVVVRL